MINARKRKKTGENSGEFLSWGGKSLPRKATFEQRLKTGIMVKDTKKTLQSQIFMHQIYNSKSSHN